MNPKLVLPKPPSINHIYGYTSRGGFARSYITKEGKEWFEKAGKELKKQWNKRVPIKTEVEVYIELYTAYYRQDVDNILKPILDLLEKETIIENDSQVTMLNVQKYKCKKTEQKVEVLVWDAD